jgi:ADP-heptose:LPS heptosyltransferase
MDLKYKTLELYLNDKDQWYTDELLKSKDLKDSSILIGLVPGAGRSWGMNAPFKHWSAENFARLADKLIEKYEAKIIIMGDFFEVGLAKTLVSNMHYKAFDFSGKTTIGQLAALLSKMKLVITNDGGPLHMASALGTKTVSIFGPVDEMVYGPYPPDEKHIVVKKELSCRPCYRNFRMPCCEYKRRCISLIEVDEVFDAVRRQL